MSEATEPVEECPACGAEKINYWDELETWICDGCSCVVEEIVPETTANPSVALDGTENDTQDWKQSISVDDSSEANLIEVVSELEQVAETLGLSDDLTLRGAEIVVEAWKTNFMHGRTKSDTVGASLYAASREMQQSIPPAFITDRIESDRQSLKNTYQQLKTDLQLQIHPPKPVEYLGQIRRELKLSTEIEEEAVELLDEQQLGGNPVGIAAAALYHTANANGDDVTFRTIAEVTGLTKETIWRHHQKIG
jgi:transcription initiation factor TFIIB